jgi:hypothetical protein
MPEGHYRKVNYPDTRELWLDQAAKENRLITCRCISCKRVVRYLAADLLPIVGPAHRAMLEPPFPCRCGERENIKVECVVPSDSDYGLLDVRRPAGVKQTQIWRTVKLGDVVENTTFGLKTPKDPLGFLSGRKRQPYP